MLIHNSPPLVFPINFVSPSHYAIQTAKSLHSARFQGNKVQQTLNSLYYHGWEKVVHPFCYERIRDSLDGYSGALFKSQHSRLRFQGSLQSGLSTVVVKHGLISLKCMQLFMKKSDQEVNSLCCQGRVSYDDVMPRWDNNVKWVVDKTILHWMVSVYCETPFPTGASIINLDWGTHGWLGVQLGPCEWGSRQLQNQ